MKCPANTSGINSAWLEKSKHPEKTSARSVRKVKADSDLEPEVVGDSITRMWQHLVLLSHWQKERTTKLLRM